MDNRTKQQRSDCMSKIKSKDTTIELLVRKELFRRGLRYRINYKKLPGKPDIVFVSKRVVIFINGCFWHGHGCKLTKQPKTNSAFWIEKITKNKKRDTENLKKLKSLGWSVIVLWECKIKENFSLCVKRVLDKLQSAG